MCHCLIENIQEPLEQFSTSQNVFWISISDYDRNIIIFVANLCSSSVFVSTLNHFKPNLYYQQVQFVTIFFILYSDIFVSVFFSLSFHGSKIRLLIWCPQLFDCLPTFFFFVSVATFNAIHSKQFTDHLLLLNKFLAFCLVCIRPTIFRYIYYKIVIICHTVTLNVIQVSRL